MASPVGHAIVGAAAASVAARVIGTPMTPTFWVGVIISSGLPDLDLLLAKFGLSGPRYHRNGSHSMLVLVAFVGAVFAATGLLGVSGMRGMLLCFAISLWTHPILDVLTTGPDLAARGYGIGLLWPVSGRRFFVNRPVVRTPELDNCRSVLQVLVAIRPEVIVLGPPTLLVLIIAGLS